ncbi:hypothetical protein PVAP13_8KG032702 [Panicum virgatum]|uniref:HMA domain-containing protein n=2 Tax=Panicum virgatum TaxID=38727 RepID=A0A8T0PD03_PANVG|nr:hypothetical protein PVAP13_8KG032702 [Panicum virgatum]
MITDGILRVKTCVLKVGIHCDGCAKKVTKVLNKIEGVYLISIEKLEGKVTVTGQMDLDTVFVKLKKAGKPARLWGATANPGVPSQGQQLQLGGGGEDQLPKGGAGAASSSSGGGMAMRQPTPEQLREQLHQQLMQAGINHPPQLMGMGGKMPLPAAVPPANLPKAVRFNVPNDGGDSGDEAVDEEDFEDDGADDDTTKMMKRMAMPPAAGGAGGSGVKKGGIGNVMPVQIKGGAGGSGKNGKSGALVGGNLQPGQGRKASGAGGPMMGMDGMAPPQPQAAMTTRPPNMMGGAAGYPGAGGQMGGMPMGHPHMAAKGMQPGGVNGMQPGGVAGGMPVGHPKMSGNGMKPGAGGSAGMQAGGKPMGYHAHIGGNSNGMQPGGGGAGTTLAPGFYHAGHAGGGSYGGGMPYGSEMMQAAGNQHVYGGGSGGGGYMPMMQQQQPQMMMNGGGYGSQGCYGGDYGSQGYYGGDHVHGGGGYYQQQQMGYGSSNSYGYGYGGQQQQLPYPSYYPRHPHDNMFSDENPNSYCSVM